MMDPSGAGLYKGEAVVTRIDMKEIGFKRLQDVVAKLETQNVTVERDHVVNALNIEYRVSHSKRTGTETGDRSPRFERIARDLRAVKHFDAIASRIMKQNQIHHAPLVSERARPTRDLDTVVFEARSQPIERVRVSPLPAVKGGAVVLSRGDNQSLTTVVHPVGSRPGAGINALHT